MTERTSARFPVRPFRRAVQLAVLAIIVLVPMAARNPVDLSMSRIVLGQMPEPTVSTVLGDTWSFEINGFQLSHPLAFFETWFSAKVIYIPLLVAALLPLILTVLLGRVFCSWMCPVGFLLELNMKTRRFLLRRGIGWRLPLIDSRYAVLGACLAAALLLAVPVLSEIDPPHALGRELMNLFAHHRLSIAGSILLLAILALDTFAVTRGCCSKLCPSGGGLALLGKYRLLRIRLQRDACIECGKCDAACPYELTPQNLALDRPFDRTKCDNCGLCRDHCPTGAITYCGRRK